MNSYIIVYDLRHFEKNYTSLYQAIKVNYPKWFHLTENSWVIFTDYSAKEISQKIKNEFYYENGYYEFDPIDDTRIAVKVMIIIELLHNRLDPVWDKYSKDVFNKENL